MTIDLSNVTDDELEKYRIAAARLLAPGLPFSAEGYREHYMGIFERRLPDHAWEWVCEFFEGYGGGARRFMFKAHRGATKSTVWTVGFASYVLAKFPEQSILIVQKSDDAGSKTAAGVADIIENNAGWKMMYPYLVPDKEQSWSSAGYEVKDTRVDYGVWRAAVQKARPKDKSFTGVGWSSGSVVGMHPFLLLIDDIHDEENTRSDREISRVKSTLTSNILQTLNRPPGEDEPLCIVSYTPWSQSDAYAYLESTGLYRVVSTPIISEAESGFEWRGKTWKMTWEVSDPVKYLDERVAEYGERDFARMLMLDLTAADGINLKKEWLHKFPADKIDMSWPVYMGVDYASSSDRQNEGDRDYFAVAIGRVIPGGGIILVDGYRGRLSQGESEEKLKAIASVHPTLQVIGFEKLGKGYDSMWSLINSGLPIMPCPRQGERKKPKGECFEGAGGLGPLFQFSRMWISSEENAFLKAFEDEWLGWPTGAHDDTLDAVYWMAYAAQGYLSTPAEYDTIGMPNQRKKSAFSQIGAALRS